MKYLSHIWTTLFYVLSYQEEKRKCQTKFFSDFFSLNVPEIDPLSLSHIWTMFNFVEIYRFDWQLSKISLRYLFSFTQPPPPLLFGWARVKIWFTSFCKLQSNSAISNERYNKSLLYRIVFISLSFDLICLYKQRYSRVRLYHKISESWSTEQRIPIMVYQVIKKRMQHV